MLRCMVNLHRPRCVAIRVALLTCFSGLPRPGESPNHFLDLRARAPLQNVRESPHAPELAALSAESRLRTWRVSRPAHRFRSRRRSCGEPARIHKTPLAVSITTPGSAVDISEPTKPIHDRAIIRLAQVLRYSGDLERALGAARRGRLLPEAAQEILPGFDRRSLAFLIRLQILLQMLDGRTTCAGAGGQAGISWSAARTGHHGENNYSSVSSLCRVSSR